jgi:lipopolysaccharide export system protein LptA
MDRSTGRATSKTTVTALLSVLGVAAVTIAAPTAAAQTGNVPNAVQGFALNRDQPLNIEATSLEYRDKAKVATFLGNVQLVQGDTMLRCKTLVVWYEQDGGAPTGGPIQDGAGGTQQFKRLEAKGNVVVTQKDQTVTGDNAVFEKRSNTVLVTGNVIITQGQCVLRGERLVVDLSTGDSRLEGGKGRPGRVHGLFQPGGCNPNPASSAK